MKINMMFTIKNLIDFIYFGNNKISSKNLQKLFVIEIVEVETLNIFYRKMLTTIQL